MTRSPLMKLIAMASWLLTAVAALNEGLRQFGYDIFKLQVFQSNPSLSQALSYAFGVAGVISLVMMVMACSGRGCHCCTDPRCGCCTPDTKRHNGVCPRCGASPCRCR